MEDKILFGHDLSEIDNLTEKVVLELIEKILNENDSICRCQLCVEDIFALSLNSMKPLYVQSNIKDHTFAGFDLRKVIDRDAVSAAINEAIDKVTHHPHH